MAENQSCFFYILNIAILFATTTILFAIIFKTLPDGEIAWKDALVGSSFTSFFFMFGKFAIGFYLGSSTVATVSSSILKRISAFKASIT